jgi:hypothetical protein
MSGQKIRIPDAACVIMQDACPSVPEFTMPAIRKAGRCQNPATANSGTNRCINDISGMECCNGAEDSAL